MSRTLFTADTHFGHANIIKYCNRPFKDVDEMDRELIRRWNCAVAPEDTVWHLGDFAFWRGVDQVRRMRELKPQLNGTINLILGNHDSMLRCACAGLFNEIRDVHMLRVEGETVFLSHYAHRVWPNKHRGVYHLWGHSHGTLPPESRSIDVGVDCWDFLPSTLGRIKSRLAHLGLDQHATFGDQS